VLKIKMGIKKFTVLLVEDNPGEARLIREILLDASGDAFDLQVVTRLADAVARLRGGDVDAMLLDLALPDSSGAATFTQAKSHAPEVPIIVLTGLGDEALALAMVQQGAQDYMVKVDLNGNVLSRSIRYAIQRANTEQQIRKLNQELEEKVRERTLELEAANRELEAFSYSVSHDLRAPLRQIEGFSAILVSDHAHKLDPEGNDCLRRIQESVTRMQAITHDLLKLARIGKLPLVRAKVSLNAMVDLIIQELRMEIGGRSIEWKIGLLPEVECDPGLIQQVFANLMGNAVKYTSKREMAVIEIGQSNEGGAPVIFIADNGAGFDMKHASQLFGAFQRLHDSEEFEGSGVGLSTVQRIIQRHDGRIWAEAAPGKGATFFFTLCSPVAVPVAG
jgi:two-component system sensor histidine kinase/response regulator